MNKSAGITLSVIAVIILIATWFLVTTPSAQAPTSATPTEDTTASQNSSSLNQTEAPSSAVVQYSSEGFSPSAVTIKQGGMVTFTSADGSNFWVASNAHPTHTEYDGTSRGEHCTNGATSSFDQCASGISYSFVFTKIGTWGYHNHMSANKKGIVNVVQ